MRPPAPRAARLNQLQLRCACVSRLRRWSLTLGIALLNGIANPAQPAAGKSSPLSRPSSLQVGTLTLQRCRAAPAWCGALARALDPAEPTAATLAIHFEYYPHRAPGPSLGLMVATEGGPGYPATESRDDYLALFRPLLARRDLLIMDNRGTGQSGALDCTALQKAPMITEENVGACGRALGPSAALYGTAFAADDLAAILEALAAGRIDLYGNSYGTYFEQVFALRHPGMLRSIVLDGAWALDGPDYAWYPTYASAMRAKFNIACRRSEACSSRAGNSIDHVAPALALLRSAPIEAQARGGNGKLRSFTADASVLATVMFGSFPAYASVRELDAAARAFAAGDQAPLLRLMAETIVGVDSRDATQAPAKFSAALAAAVTCHDPPQIFDMSLTPERRIGDRDRAIAHRKLTAPDSYAPFTIDEYRGMPLDYSFIDECVRWPVAPPGHPASQVVPVTAAYPDVPALIISGELDNMTTLADGAAVAKRFPHGQQLIIANSFHVNALPRARSGCAAEIVRRFVATLEAGDTHCAHSVPEVRLAPQFVRHLSELAPARAAPGNAATPAQLRAAAGALLTAGDVIARLSANSSGEGVGLRGGTFRIQAHTDGYTLILRAVRWSEDLSVSGTIRGPERSGRVVAELALTGADELSGPLMVSWIEGVAHARAQIRGKLGNAALAAEMAAP
jgi:pimeloyl-ACP methyl ester carboxylesterase